jgi:uncharacterized protein (TIGR00304 family)
MSLTDRLVFVGVALIIFGFLLTFAGILYSTMTGSKTQVRGGGVVFIGPIPIVFGTDKKMAFAVAVLAVILMLLYIALFRIR